MLRVLFKGVDHVMLLTAYAAGFVLIVVTVMIVGDISMRYILDKPLLGSVELSTYALVYMCFLSIGWIHSVKGHVSLDLFICVLRPRHQKIMLITGGILGLVYCCTLVWLTWENAWSSYKSGFCFSGELEGIPQFPVLVSIPIGFVLLAVQIIFNFLKELCSVGNKRISESPNMPEKDTGGQGTANS